MKKILIVFAIIITSIALLFDTAVLLDNILDIGFFNFTSELNKTEENSRKKFKELFENDFNNYKIKDVKQITDVEGFGTNITDIAKCEVEIDGKQYLFFYDCHIDKFFSNFYYDQVVNEIKQYYLEKTPENFPMNDLIISLSNYHEFVDDNTIRYEDRTFADILNRNEIEDYSLYDIRIDYYIEKSADFSPKNYELEKLFEGNEDITITVLKADEEYKTNKNELFVQEEYEYSLYEGNVTIHKKVNEKVEYNNIIFIYDKNLIDFELLPPDETIVEKYSKKIIRENPINCGFRVKAEQKGILEEEYKNCIQTTTSIFYNEHVIRILMDKETYFGKYIIDGEFNRYLNDDSNKEEKYLYEFLPVYQKPIDQTYIFCSKK